MKDRLILVDYDGVMTDFCAGFDSFMGTKGSMVISEDEYDLSTRYTIFGKELTNLIHEFSHTGGLKTCPPFKDAVDVIANLKNKGFAFHCITAIDPALHDERLEHAETIFGSNVFEELHCVTSSKNKDNVLKRYENSGCIWVEDSPDNVMLGVKHDLTPVLMAHPYNRYFEHPLVRRANSWMDVQLIAENI